METTDVELVAQRVFSLGAQLQHLVHADFVGGGLAGHDQVTTHFRFHRRLGNGAVFGEIGHRLFLGPALGMQAGIHHQADRAPHLRHQPAVVGIRVLVGARHFLGQAFAVQPPAFGIGTEHQLGAELRQAGQLLGDGQLHVMARQCLVVGNHLQLGLRHRAHVGHVHVVDARTRTIGGARVVVLGGTGLLAERLDPAYFQRRLRQQAEIVRQQLADVVDGRVGIGHVGGAAFVGIGVLQRRVVGHMGEECLQVTFHADGFLDRLHRPAQARDIGQADLVDLLGGQLGGGVLLELVAVIRRAVVGGLGGADTGRIDQRLLTRTIGPGNDPAVGRLDAVQQRAAGLGLQLAGTFSGDLLLVHQGIGLALQVRPQGTVSPAAEGGAGNQRA